MIRHPTLLAALVMLAACQPRTNCEAPPAPQPAAIPAGAAEDPRAAIARGSVNERLRARLREEAADPRRQRAVLIHRQATAETLAVCGQVNPTGRSDDPYLPFVTVIAFDGTVPRVTEFSVGASSAEATRTYVLAVEHCFDGGGPSSVRPQRRSLPPTPDQDPTPLRAAPSPASPASPAAAPAATMQAAPVGASVTVSQRSPANIRATPGGGGEIIRSAPRGATLEVFATVPGGWVQVGQGGSIWGWVHMSLMETP